MDSALLDGQWYRRPSDDGTKDRGAMAGRSVVASAIFGEKRTPLAKDGACMTWSVVGAVTSSKIGFKGMG